MPITLRKLRKETGIDVRRWKHAFSKINDLRNVGESRARKIAQLQHRIDSAPAQEAPMSERGPNRPQDGDTAQKDYDEAYDAGKLLDPLPDDYIKVRDIASECQVHVSRLLGGDMVDWKSPVEQKTGITMNYGPNWEVYVSPADADKLREYCKTLS